MSIILFLDLLGFFLLNHKDLSDLFLLKLSEAFKSDSTLLGEILSYIDVHDFRPSPASCELCCWLSSFFHRITVRAPSHPQRIILLVKVARKPQSGLQSRKHWLGKELTSAQRPP